MLLHNLIHEIAPLYVDRNGGYTRIIKLNNRKNDNAPVSFIEFIDISMDPVSEGEVDKNEPVILNQKDDD